MASETSVVVIGSGGHAKVVISTLLHSGFKVSTILDDREERWGETMLGVPIMGPISQITGRENACCIIAIGSNMVRKKLSQDIAISCLSAIHPFTFVHPSVEIGEGTVICAGAVIQPGVRIGKHVIVNTSSSIDHDCVIGDYVQIAPGVHIGGDVKIEEGVLIDIGSSINRCVYIGQWCTIGAGCTIINDIHDHSSIGGIKSGS